MKKDEVPSEEGFLDGYHRAAYAVDDAGRYTVVPSSGWSAEVAATNVALAEVDQTVATAWQLAKSGQRSPLAYHMAQGKMSLSLLAQYVGLSRLRVWWHLRPRGFKGMPLGTALRYCRAMDLPIERFVTIPEAPERLLQEEDA